MYSLRSGDQFSVFNWPLDLVCRVIIASRVTLKNDSAIEVNINIGGSSYPLDPSTVICFLVDSETPDDNRK